MTEETTRIVMCRKYGKDLPGLGAPPFPGEEGDDIFASISQQAWDDWLSLQTMLINEKRLRVFDPKAKAYLAEQRRKFLANQETDRPVGYRAL